MTREWWNEAGRLAILSQVEPVIREHMQQIGRLDDYANSRLGSWWYCEFRERAVEAYRLQSPEAALAYIRAHTATLSP